MTYPSKFFKLADMLYYEHEDQAMKVLVLRDIPLVPDKEKDAQKRGVELLEECYGIDEWIIDFNRTLSLHIDNNYYRVLPTSDFDINYSSQVMRKSFDRYKFCLFITDLADEYSRIEIITDYTVKANNYNAAIGKTSKWIEQKYKHFKELEWYINDRVHIYIL